MNEFLIELGDLLEKYNATILRSAADTHKLVLSTGRIAAGRSVMTFTELEFCEDITKEAIRNEWYTPLSKVSP